jgi:hypothetical protein
VVVASVVVTPLGVVAGRPDGAVDFFRSVGVTRFLEQCAVVPG